MFQIMKQTNTTNMTTNKHPVHTHQHQANCDVMSFMSEVQPTMQFTIESSFSFSFSLDIQGLPEYYENKKKNHSNTHSLLKCRNSQLHLYCSVVQGGVNLLQPLLTSTHSRLTLMGPLRTFCSH